MFSRIEAHRYRCLRSADRSINSFEILIGPNASGKSTFLDVVAFLGDVISFGLEAAVEKRTANFHDLVYGRRDSSFNLFVEAPIPEAHRKEIQWASEFGPPDVIRYEILIELDVSTEKLHIAKETVGRFYSHVPVDEWRPVEDIVIRSTGVFFRPETRVMFEPSRPEFHRNYSSLNSLPSDADFPATAWLRDQLRSGVRPVVLDLNHLRKPSPPATTDQSDMSGSYLARSVAQLRSRNAGDFTDWLAHVRMVLPDVKDIRTTVLEADRHRYVVVDYENGFSVPSWMLSDGTLRLLALTILAYLPDFNGVYLVEEPENGVHPAALQAIYDSLSSVYAGQVLVTSHSPVLLGLAKPEQLLCFSKTPDGINIVRGSEHRALRDWKGEVSLGVLAASGILG